MHCLHICNDLFGSKVHENLYKNLNSPNLDQTIYHPARADSENLILKMDSDLRGKITLSNTIHSVHRFLFRNKINFLYKDLTSKLDLKSFDLVHATTLFSDGALAYKIHKDFGIPYILAIRGTDINLFLKYRYDLYPLGKQIIENAEKLIFISKSLEVNFNKSFFAKILNYNQNKQIVIPNGIDSHWLKNQIAQRKTTKPKNFLYIGKFDANKNVLRVIKAFLSLSSSYKNITLNLVGKGGNQEAEIIKLVKKYPQKIKFHGAVHNKAELEDIYRKNDVFVMASISETFGLVYVEALTQGLPLLFTKNQGIDLTFKENIGIPVNPKSSKSIQQGMEKLIENYDSFEIDKINFQQFRWEDIAKKYLSLYFKILKPTKPF